MIDKVQHRPWKVINSKNILHIGPWLSVRQECVELPSGKQIPTWFILEYPNWINVIAETKDGQLVMIDQYRHGLGVTKYELVAGVIDEGETPLQAAQRELLEETGFGGGEWSEFMTLCPNTSCQNNLSYTFLARGVERLEAQHQESTEDICVHVMGKDDVWQLLQQGEIIQALHAAPLWKYFASVSGKR
ncbi:MAG: NUDIX hydrolase [Paludibacteraceae bacterium]|nr:NUDIX hydrolase [Paludibacteraceae bacterium]